MSQEQAPNRTLMVACGALAKEVTAVLSQTRLLGQEARSVDPATGPAIDVRYLPALLHNRPQEIVPELLKLLDAGAAKNYDRLIIGYGDCGTGGHLDQAISQLRSDGMEVHRLFGDHCYEFFTGSDAYAELHQEELGTFFLTDYLARHFDRIIWQTYRFDEHPELIEMMFGNYRRVVYLTQDSNPKLTAAAERAATKLGLSFEVRQTGLGPFSEALVSITTSRNSDLTAEAA